MSYRGVLRAAWEQFLKDRDSQAFQAIVDKHLGGIPTGIEYPYLHRIRDVVLAKKGYRLIRFYDQSDGTETIYVDRVSNPNPDLGVPYWLSGIKLKEWIEDECENPSQGPVDWEKYR